MKTKLAAALLTGLFSTASLAQDLSISLTNLTHGNHFTPLLVAAHTTTQPAGSPFRTYDIFSSLYSRHTLTSRR